MEVFPTLHLEGDCKVYMEDVRVDRVVTTRARDLLKVYISCDNIIEKEYIYKVEKELHKQLFLFTIFAPLEDAFSYTYP